MHATGAATQVTEHSADEALIARLLQVISGDAPRSEATHLLAPDVISHMDQYTVRGIDVWFDWLDFLLSNAKGNVKVDVDRFEHHSDGTITAYGWLRVERSAERTPHQNWARYRVDERRIAEVWTTRGNYEAVFGAKVHNALRWLLVLIEMAVWRRLPWRSPTRLSPTVEESVDGRTDEPRDGGAAHDDPERRRTDRERG
ncbi:MAG TPA: hypothetical protein VJT85_01040 [Gemmatimonadaceae bacterium]|nr:hypothetical protein [Gemmatimonadaceae bacterium]